MHARRNTDGEWIFGSVSRSPLGFAADVYVRAHLPRSLPAPGSGVVGRPARGRHVGGPPGRGVRAGAGALVPRRRRAGRPAGAEPTRRGCSRRLRRLRRRAATRRARRSLRRRRARRHRQALPDVGRRRRTSSTSSTCGPTATAGSAARPAATGADRSSRASQMLGQAIVAAGRHAPDRRPVSASMAFTRAADAHHAAGLRARRGGRGRTFTTLSARRRQGGRLCGAGTLLLDVTAARRHPPRRRGPGRRRSLREPRPSTCGSPAATSASSTAPTPATPRPRSARRCSTPGCGSATARRPAAPRRPAGPVHRPHVDRRRAPAPRRHRAGPGPSNAVDRDQRHRHLVPRAGAGRPAGCSTTTARRSPGTG